MVYVYILDGIKLLHGICIYYKTLIERLYYIVLYNSVIYIYEYIECTYISVINHWAYVHEAASIAIISI